MPISHLARKLHSSVSAGHTVTVPLFMFADDNYQRYRSLPSDRLYEQRMKKAHATGTWDIIPDFDKLL